MNKSEELKKHFNDYWDNTRNGIEIVITTMSNDIFAKHYEYAQHNRRVKIRNAYYDLRTHQVWILWSAE